MLACIFIAQLLKGLVDQKLRLGNCLYFEVQIFNLNIFVHDFHEYPNNVKSWSAFFLIILLVGI